MSEVSRSPDSQRGYLFEPSDWRGIHYGTYILIRLLEVITWSTGAGLVGYSIATAFSTQPHPAKGTHQPDLGSGLALAVSVVILTFIFTIAIRLLAAFTLRRSLDGLEDQFDGEA